jgi:branched-chain amino acid aminotransferase
MLAVTITKAKQLKDKPSEDNLGFGQHFTDHMFMMDYTEGTGWHDARVIPYQPLTLDPATMVFHYGQEMFEGLKAYRNPKNEVILFRPEKNAERVNVTNDRLCLPELPVEDFVQSIKELIKVDESWVPYNEGNSLYIRPFIIETDP